MYIRLERGASAPISKQIGEQIRAQILGGLLRPGECLPSVRQLAQELVVNVNTIVRVYERLAADGLLEVRHGLGTFVLPPPADVGQATKITQHREQFAREFQSIVRRGLLLGLTVPDLRSMLTVAASEAKNYLASEKQAENGNE